MDSRSWIRIVRDPSLYVLLLANLGVFWGLWQGEITAADAYWVYWIQSIIMIMTWTARLAGLGYSRPGSGADLGISVSVTTFSGEIKDESDYTGVQTFLFYALGFFLLYVPFLLVIVGAPSFSTFLFTVPGFAVAHTTSFFFHRGEGGDGKDILTEFGKRLIPMHLSLVFGAFFVASQQVWLISLLKMGMDVVAHASEHASKE